MSLENVNIWNVICYRKDIMCRILYTSNPNETELSITVSIFVKIG